MARPIGAGVTISMSVAALFCGSEDTAPCKVALLSPMAVAAGVSAMTAPEPSGDTAISAGAIVASALVSSTFGASPAVPPATTASGAASSARGAPVFSLATSTTTGSGIPGACRSAGKTTTRPTLIAKTEAVAVSMGRVENFDSMARTPVRIPVLAERSDIGRAGFAVSWARSKFSMARASVAAFAAASAAGGADFSPTRSL